MNDLFDWFEQDKTFLKYHEEHPNIYDEFKRWTFDRIRSGYSNFGANSIVEKIRWETPVGADGKALKCNNNFAAGYARLFEKDHPEHQGFFRMRKLQKGRNKL